MRGLSIFKGNHKGLVIPINPTRFLSKLENIFGLIRTSIKQHDFIIVNSVQSIPKLFVPPTFKQCFTRLAGHNKLPQCRLHMQIPTCDLICQ